jgi:hypothetical protein
MHLSPCVFGGKGIEMLEGTRFEHLHHAAPNLEIAEGPTRVVAEQGDPRVVTHVPLFSEAPHGVDPNPGPIEVTPNDRGLRIAVRHDRGQDGDRRALDKIAMRLRYGIHAAILPVLAIEF